MQNQNVISIDYLKNPARFADLLNGYVYHGQEMVKVVMSHSSKLIEYKQENISNKGGSNMCQAILEMIEDGRQEGVQEGIQEGIKVLVESCQEFGISKEDATLKVREKYKLTEEQAVEKIALYWVE